MLSVVWLIWSLCFEERISSMLLFYPRRILCRALWYYVHQFSLPMLHIYFLMLWIFVHFIDSFTSRLTITYDSLLNSSCMLLKSICLSFIFLVVFKFKFIFFLKGNHFLNLFILVFISISASLMSSLRFTSFFSSFVLRISFIIPMSSFC